MNSSETHEVTVSFGEFLYNAYVAAVGNKTYDDKPCPAFHNLPARQRNGWQTAAVEFKQMIEWNPSEK